MSDTIAPEIARLKKTFDRPTVNDLSPPVFGGAFYALLGPNGADRTIPVGAVVAVY